MGSIFQKAIVNWFYFWKIKAQLIRIKWFMVSLETSSLAPLTFSNEITFFFWFAFVFFSQVEVPAVSAGNGSFLTMPLNTHPASSTSLTNQHMSFSLLAADVLERSFIISGMYSRATGVHLYMG